MRNFLLFVCIVGFIFFVSQSAAKSRHHHHKHHVPHKKIKTPEITGSAKQIKGKMITTRLHKLCSMKKRLKNKPDEWTEDKTVYDKMICGFYTMDDEYQKHSDRAAAILTGNTNKKTLEEQKKELFDAIHNMAKASGPLPQLNLKMIGK